MSWIAPWLGSGPPGDTPRGGESPDACWRPVADRRLRRLGATRRRRRSGRLSRGNELTEWREGAAGRPCALSVVTARTRHCSRTLPSHAALTESSVGLPPHSPARGTAAGSAPTGRPTGPWGLGCSHSVTGGMIAALGRAALDVGQPGLRRGRGVLPPQLARARQLQSSGTAVKRTPWHCGRSRDRSAWP
jgi:hypothetical protein